MTKNEISRVNIALLNSYDTALKKVAKEYDKYLMLPEKERKLEIQSKKAQEISDKILYAGAALFTVGFFAGMAIFMLSSYDDRRWVYAVLPSFVTFATSPIIEGIIEEKKIRLKNIQSNFEESNGEQKVKLAELHSTIKALNNGEQSEGLNFVRTFLSNVNLEGNTVYYNMKILGSLAHVAKLFDQINSGQAKNKEEFYKELGVFINQLRHGTTTSKYTSKEFKENGFLKEYIGGYDDIMNKYETSEEKGIALKKGLLAQ